MKNPIRLALLALAAVPVHAQIGGPPATPPGGPTAKAGGIWAHEGSGGTKILTRKTQLSSSTTALVYDLDAAGDLRLEAEVPTPAGSARGIGRDRFLVLKNYYPTGVQVFERGPTGWSLGYELVGPAPSPALRYGLPSVIEDQTVLLADPANSEIDVFDVSVPGTATLIDEIVLPAPKVAASMWYDGTDLVVTVENAQFGGGGTEVLVYAPGPSGFTLVQTLTPPPGIDWFTSGAFGDVDAGRLAIGAIFGTATSPCGRTLVYEKLNGVFVLDAVLVGSGQCTVTPTIGSRFGGVAKLRGDDLLIGAGSTGVVIRYRKTSSGWVEGERHLTAGWDYPAYEIAGPWVLGASAPGVQVFDTVDSAGDIDLVCPALISSQGTNNWVIDSRGRTSLGVQPLTFSTLIAGSSGTALTLLLAGSDRGFTPLGQTARLCLGGRIARRQMQTSELFGIAGAMTTFDPAGAGFLGGDTVLFQIWRREPGFPGGVTTNAIAITFAP